MTETEQRDYLTAKGWEQALTEEDGCETWTYPKERRGDWPEWARFAYGTHYWWDLDEAFVLQKHIDEPADLQPLVAAFQNLADAITASPCDAETKKKELNDLGFIRYKMVLAIVERVQVKP